MSKTTVWVMPIGPLTVHPQFVKDIERRSVEWYINDISIPKDVNDALQLLYEQCGNHFYMVTKYMNQTMGNMMYSHIHRMHWHGIICQVKDTFVIKAYVGAKNRIYASIGLELFDDKFRVCKRIRVVSMLNMDNCETIISIINNI